MPRVIVADDSPTMRALVRMALKGLPVELVDAVDGVQAVALCQGEPPLLLLIDLHMPRLDGTEATRQLRASTVPAVSSIPIFLMTADRDDETRARCLDAGATALLTKPLRPGEVRGVVERQLGAAR